MSDYREPKYTTVKMLKAHSYIDTDDEDEYLSMLLSASEDIIETALQRKLYLYEQPDGTLPGGILMGIYLEAGTLYANREQVAYTAANAVPFANVKAKIKPFINHGQYTDNS